MDIVSKLDRLLEGTKEFHVDKMQKSALAHEKQMNSGNFRKAAAASLGVVKNVQKIEGGVIDKKGMNTVARNLKKNIKEKNVVNEDNRKEIEDNLKKIQDYQMKLSQAKTYKDSEGVAYFQKRIDELKKKNYLTK